MFLFLMFLIVIISNTGEKYLEYLAQGWVLK